jgi:6-phosphogluconolactonase/glucosamine-6-phosphate isomerase/deaminase
MATPSPEKIRRRVVGSNVWLGHPRARGRDLADLQVQQITPSILESEKAVGAAMLREIEEAAAQKSDDLVIILLGGRGAQALHRQLGELARTSAADQLLGRLHVFMQDGLAPMSADNSFSFLRDFERLLGLDFFRKVKSFTAMRTDAGDLESELARYAAKLESLGGIDIFFLGLGPEPEGASHLAYIRPGSGATADDIAGMIPISASILEHHVAKFKVGGSAVTEEDEAECRRATHILTLGPAAILNARRIVQSVVDATSSPLKRASYRRFLDDEISADGAARLRQLDENPGLWLRLHPNVSSLILPDVLTP